MTKVARFAADAAPTQPAYSPAPPTMRMALTPFACAAVDACCAQIGPLTLSMSKCVLTVPFAFGVTRPTMRWVRVEKSTSAIGYRSR